MELYVYLAEFHIVCTLDGIAELHISKCVVLTCCFIPCRVPVIVYVESCILLILFFIYSDQTFSDRTLIFNALCEHL